MNPIVTININGENRKALFSAFLWRRLSEKGITVNLNIGNDLQSQLEAQCEFVSIIYGGLLNAMEYGIEDKYELTLLDVDMWAAENKGQFKEMITYIVKTLTTDEPNEEGSNTPSKKKHLR